MLGQVGRKFPIIRHCSVLVGPWIEDLSMAAEMIQGLWICFECPIIRFELIWESSRSVIKQTSRSCAWELRRIAFGDFLVGRIGESLRLHAQRRFAGASHARRIPRYAPRPAVSIPGQRQR